MRLSFLQVEQLTVLSILFFLIVIGNSAVLVTLYLNKRRKSRMNFFIMQLAAAGHYQVLI
jgi:neuropeptide S receptor 1